MTLLARMLVVAAIGALSAACVSSTYPPSDSSADTGAQSDLPTEATTTITRDPDADASAPKTFVCPGATRDCTTGTEVCCGTFAAAECTPVAKASSCMLGFLRCSDSADCGAGETCCGSLDSSDVSSCKATCGSSEKVLCDPARAPAHCPNGGACTGAIGDAVPVCE